MNISNPAKRSGSALIFLIIGVFLSIKSITSSILAASYFIPLLLITIGCSALIFFSDRIAVIDLMRLKFTLHEVKTREQNVKLMEQKVQRIAALLTDLAVFLSDSFMLTETQEGEKTDYNRILSELKKLSLQK